MITETIQLQKQYPQHTLIVEVNHAGARFALGHGQQLDLLSPISPNTSETYSDNEGHSHHGSDGHVSSSSSENNHLKQHNQKVLANQVIDRIKYLSGENKFKHLKLYVTVDYKKDLESKLPDHIKASAEITVGNHGHDTWQDLA